MIDLREAVKRADAILDEVRQKHGKLDEGTHAALRIRICKALRDATREPVTACVDQLRAMDTRIQDLEAENARVKARFETLRAKVYSLSLEA